MQYISWIQVSHRELLRIHGSKHSFSVGKCGRADTLAPLLVLKLAAAAIIIIIRERERERTGHTARVGWWQEPVRNARRPGLILTRDSSQIRVRVACSAGSEKAGQPPSGFVATTPAALHGVAANCPSASPRRLRPR